MKKHFVWLGAASFLVAISFSLGAHGALAATTTTVKKVTTPAKKPSLSAAAKQQLIVDVLADFIKIYGNNPTESEKAWWRARISCGELTSETALISSMQYTMAHKARVGSPAICGKVVPNNSGVTTAQVPGIGNSKMGDQIRVGIYDTDGKTAISATSDAIFEIREGTDKIVKKLKPNQVVSVTFTGGLYHVRGSGVKIDTDQYIRLVPENLGFMYLTSYKDLSVAHPGLNYNKFRGVIEIRKCDTCNELWAINELRVEYYIRGLGETSGTGPDEYLKALSIVARTYALYHEVDGGRYIPQHFDIGSTATDQIYRGANIESVAPEVAAEFGTTKGIILAYGDDNEPIASVYFSDSDGHTRTAKEVWGTDRFPYLQKSVADPFHVSSTCLGHCVGLSAQGAYGFAKHDGWTFQQILHYYYYDVKLVRAY